MFKTSSGIEIELNENDMHAVHQHYIEQCTADYLRENHVDWSEDKIQVVAIEARRQMLKHDFTEEEAIDEALEAYEKEHSEEQIEEECAMSEEDKTSAPMHHRRNRGR